MTELIIHARPRSVAIAAALPFLVGAVALVATPSAAGRSLVFPVALYAGVAMVLAWSWVVGGALNERIAAGRRPPIAAFRLAVVFCAVYVALFLTATFASGAMWIGRVPVVLLALHLLALLAMLKIVRFIGVNLSLAEAAAGMAPAPPGRTALALSSVAGIVAVQKRINRLFGA
jgi:hypothetical protein